MFSQFDYSHRSPRVRRRGLSLVSCIWLLAFVSAGLWLLLGPSAKESQKPIAELSAQPAELASFHQSVDSRYRSIEQIRVGQRVVTPEASSPEGLPTAVDPLTWKKLTLQAKARWEDGTIDDIEIQTLQPSAWLALHQAVVGASVPIPLDLREMGLPQMNATVMAIDPCPAIEEGPGRVVLTTVNHLNRFLYDLKVHGERGPPQAVEVTGWHKLYSEDRQAWTSVCELHLGEVLRGREGELTVESLAKHPGVQRVYNLTVEEEHQYYVSTADLLAHNANCLNLGKDAREAVEDALVHGDINVTTAQRAGVAAPPQHHVFPQGYRTWFAERGIDVDQFTVTLDEGTHQALHYGGGPGQGGGWWNDTIMTNLRNTEARYGRRLTPPEIIQIGQDMMDRAGISDLPLERYRK